MIQSDILPRNPRFLEKLPIRCMKTILSRFNLSANQIIHPFIRIIEPFARTRSPFDPRYTPKYNYIPASCRSFSFCLLIITHCCDSVAPFSKIKLRKPSEFFLTIISGVLLLKIERPYVIS